MYLPDLTTRDVGAFDRALPVVIPFAAIEQHGPHLPIGTDSFIVEGILRRLEEREPRACLWLPVACYGSSPHHMAFPGTATLSSRTFIDLARDLAASFVAHGFTSFVLFNGHGGNRAHLDVAVQEIRMGGARNVLASPQGRRLRVVHATYWTVASRAFGEIRESPRGGMGHAGEMETSIILALRPDLVREDLAAPDGERGRSRLDQQDMLEPAGVGQFRFFDECSRAGPIGDPTTASAEKGRRFLDAAVDGLIEVLEDLRGGRLG